MAVAAPLSFDVHDSREDFKLPLAGDVGCVQFTASTRRTRSTSPPQDEEPQPPAARKASILKKSEDMAAMQIQQSARMRVNSDQSASSANKHVSFMGHGEREVRTFNPNPELSEASAGGPRRCCLVQLCKDFCDAVKEGLTSGPMGHDQRAAEEEEIEEDFPIDLIEGRTVYEGYLWKLNGGVDEEGIDQIANWRRRQFFLQRASDKLTLMYTSEKENGQLQVSCYLANKEDEKAEVKNIAELKTLKAASLVDLTEDVKERVLNDMQTYDTAFGVKREVHEYERELPLQMHPFRINWINEDNETKELTLGATNTKICKLWVSTVERTLRQMQRGHAAKKKAKP